MQNPTGSFDLASQFDSTLDTREQGKGNAKIQREESSPVPREVPETSQATLFK